MKKRKIWLVNIENETLNFAFSSLEDVESAIIKWFHEIEWDHDEDENVHIEDLRHLIAKAKEDSWGYFKGEEEDGYILYSFYTINFYDNAAKGD